MNRDLVDQPSDQIFVIFLDDGRPLPQEEAHFGVPPAQVVPTDVFHQSLLLFIAPQVNLFSHLGNVGTGTSQLQQLNLQID